MHRSIVVTAISWLAQAQDEVVDNGGNIEDCATVPDSDVCVVPQYGLQYDINGALYAVEDEVKVAGSKIVGDSIIQSLASDTELVRSNSLLDGCYAKPEPAAPESYHAVQSKIAEAKTEIQAKLALIYDAQTCRHEALVEFDQQAPISEEPVDYRDYVPEASEPNFLKLAQSEELEASAADADFASQLEFGLWQSQTASEREAENQYWTDVCTKRANEEFQALANEYGNDLPAIGNLLLAEQQELPIDYDTLQRDYNLRLSQYNISSNNEEIAYFDYLQVQAQLANPRPDQDSETLQVQANSAKQAYDSAVGVNNDAREIFRASDNINPYIDACVNDLKFSDLGQTWVNYWNDYNAYPEIINSQIDVPFTPVPIPDDIQAVMDELDSFIYGNTKFDDFESYVESQGPFNVAYALKMSVLYQPDVWHVGSVALVEDLINERLVEPDLTFVLGALQADVDQLYERWQEEEDNLSAAQSRLEQLNEENRKYDTDVVYIRSRLTRELLKATNQTEKDALAQEILSLNDQAKWDNLALSIEAQKTEIEKITDDVFLAQRTYYLRLQDQYARTESQEALSQLQEQQIADLGLLEEQDSYRAQCAYTFESQAELQQQLAELQAFEDGYLGKMLLYEPYIDDVNDCESTIFRAEAIKTYQLSYDQEAFQQQKASVYTQLVQDQLDAGLPTEAIEEACAQIEALEIEIELMRNKTYDINRQPPGVPEFNEWGQRILFDYKTFEPDFLEAEYTGKAWECTRSEEQFELAKEALLEDIYSAENRGTFNNCTGLTLREPTFGGYPVFDSGLDPQDPTSSAGQFDLTYLQSNITAFNADTADSIRLRNEYYTQYSQINEFALQADYCVIDVPTWDSDIVNLENSIKDLQEQQNGLTLLESYWIEYDVAQEVEIAIESTNADLFQVQSFTDTLFTRTNPDRLLQATATGTGDDFVIVPFLEANDRPVKIMTCTRPDPISQEPLLTGFQVLYGTETNLKAGAAHGDISSECVTQSFQLPIIEVSTYANVGRSNAGIEFLMQPVQDGSASPISLSGGAVDQPYQQFKRTIRFESTGFATAQPTEPDSGDEDTTAEGSTSTEDEVVLESSYSFFGFQTITEDGLITSITPLSYDPDLLYEALYDRSFEEQIRQQSLNWWANKRYVDGLIENKEILKNVPEASPVPINPDLYRPEDFAADQAEIDLMIGLIDGGALLRQTAETDAPQSDASDAEEATETDSVEAVSEETSTPEGAVNAAQPVDEEGSSDLAESAEETATANDSTEYVGRVTEKIDTETDYKVHDEPNKYWILGLYIATAVGGILFFALLMKCVGKLLTARWRKQRMAVLHVHIDEGPTVPVPESSPLDEEEQIKPILKNSGKESLEVHVSEEKKDQEEPHQSFNSQTPALEDQNNQSEVV